MTPRYPLTVLAWANVGVHLVGLALAAVGMSPGTALAPLPERLEYLARAPAGWTLAWACWMLCAAMLIAFLATVTQRLKVRGELARLGLMIAIAGAAFDLFCDSVYIVVFPMLAVMRPTPEALFLTVERMTGVGSLVIANGAYSIGILIITVALQGHKHCDSFTASVGYAVGVFGLLLCGAGFTGVPWHAQWATPPTIGLFCVWVVCVARCLDGAGEVP
jgi:hypothetical protein